jgi:hypothetical protein
VSIALLSNDRCGSGASVHPVGADVRLVHNRVVPLSLGRTCGDAAGDVQKHELIN